MNAETQRIFEELILKRGVVTAEQLAAARRAQAESIEEGEPGRGLLDVLIEQHPAERGTFRRLADLAALRSGQTRVSIAGFELLEQIGGGGMSAVYRANQTRMGRQVAVKLMKPNVARNKKSLERFVQEARASARITHPNVVEAIDAGQD
ncbi:MAG: protein kinase domain-containing protein, partial [bacterium]